MRRRDLLLGGAAAIGGKLCAAHEPLGRIAFLQKDGLWIRELDGGKARRLMAGEKLSSPRFSPSGRWIACGQEASIRVIKVDGSGGSSVATVGSSEFQWGPSRDELVVSNRPGLNVLRASTNWQKAARTIEDAYFPVVFSPDGSEIVYGDAITVGRGAGGEAMRTGRLCRISLAEPLGQPKILMHTYLSALIPLAWIAKTGQVLFWVDEDFSGSAMSDGLPVWRVPAEGGSAIGVPVATLIHLDLLSFSTTGDKLAVCAGDRREEWENKRIAVLDCQTGAITYLTDAKTAAVCPAWSPDGKTLAYSAAPAPVGMGPGGGDEAKALLAKRRIWLMDAATGKDQRRITADARYRDEEPMWSSDGQHLLFGRINAADARTLWMMDREGGDLAQVTGPLDSADELESSWFGYYGYIDWRRSFDWFRKPLTPITVH